MLFLHFLMPSEYLQLSPCFNKNKTAYLLKYFACFMVRIGNYLVMNIPFLVCGRYTTALNQFTHHIDPWELSGNSAKDKQRTLHSHISAV